MCWNQIKMYWKEGSEKEREIRESQREKREREKEKRGRRRKREKIQQVKPMKSLKTEEEAKETRSQAKRLTRAPLMQCHAKDQKHQTEKEMSLKRQIFFKNTHASIGEVVSLNLVEGRDSVSPSFQRT